MQNVAIILFGSAGVRLCEAMLWTCGTRLSFSRGVQRLDQYYNINLTTGGLMSCNLITIMHVICNYECRSAVLTVLDYS